MSFFNLTALGPQNIFRQNQLFLHLFTTDDLKQSFNNFVKDEACTRKDRKRIGSNQILELLTDLYRGPPPPNDLEAWKQELALEESSHFTLNDLTEALERASSRHKIEQETENVDVACGSWTEYHDAASRHVRKPKGPQELFPNGPLTSGQDYGWDANTVAVPRENFARKSCPETDYASHLIKSGIV